ncbi:choice-of-anchor tandem repeat GloVer-containing protein [Acidicapsa ligni]|uniref:choice-of-anchor tandem repeat GloVer-containing protein n=1 Tax=Acidicapsa ligni TaxID=542300 RepID=UPI0021DF9C84|nr:choice-of-anchor tandem repeat GloVer-containing protein [Acidicapsa ligni]
MKRSFSAILGCGMSAAVLCAAFPAVGQLPPAEAALAVKSAKLASRAGASAPANSSTGIFLKSTVPTKPQPALAPYPLMSKVLHSFTGAPKDGAVPVGQLMQASDGNYYGTAYAGGTSGNGTIYQLTPAGQYTEIYSFTGGNDGGQPYAGLIEAADGNLYGTTAIYGQFGDDSAGGTIFAYNMATQKVTTLYGFRNGGGALGDAIDDGNGTLYGTSLSDGEKGYGSVWSWNYYTNTFKTLYSFQGSADGAEPFGGLVLASDGRLYGTASQGGKVNNGGTAFTLNTDGSEFTAFYSFTNFETGLDGGAPSQDLVEGPDGNLYGTSSSGGFQNVEGALFRIVPNGVNSVLEPLAALGQDELAEGGNPFLGRPLIGGDGYMYIVGSVGGYEGAGQVMQFDYQGNLTATVYNFEQPNDGYAVEPTGGLIETADGSLYGTAELSPFSSGILYALPTQLPPALTLTPSVTTGYVGIPLTLNWSVNNAFSQNASVCIARSTDGTFGGNGSDGIREPIGSEQVTPVASGVVSYYLTCGGIETAIATVTVNRIQSKTNVLHMNTPLTYGQGLVFSTKVAGTMGTSVPTGTVSLMNGTKVLGTAVLSGGLATINASSLSLVPGVYSLQVAYSGDGTFAASTAPASTVTVNLLVPTVTLTASPNRLTQGLPTKFNVAMSNGGIDLPSGYVSLTIGSTSLGSFRVGGGVATIEFSTTPYAAGTYAVVATYQGDAYNKTEKATTSLTLTLAETASTLTGPTTMSAGSGATYHVAVSRFNLPESPTGNVSLMFGSKVVATGILSNGQVTIQVPANAVAAGTYSVQAKYAGDTSDGDSWSPAFSVKVSK